MKTSSTTQNDISYEPTADETTAYQGRHRRLDVPCVEELEDAAPVSGSHPRRRGFGILSRLARVEADPEDAAEVAPTGAHRALVDA
jgi:hypothetical protein